MELLYKLGLRKRKTRREQVQESVADTILSIADTLDEIVREKRRPSSVAMRAEDTLKMAGQQASDTAGKVAKRASDVAERATSTASVVSEKVTERASEVAGKATEKASGVAAQATATAGVVAEQVRQGAGKVAEQVSEKVGKVRDETEQTAPEVMEAGKEAAEKLAAQARTLRDETEQVVPEIVEASKEAGEETSKKLNAILAALGALTANWDQIAKSVNREAPHPFSRNGSEGEAHEEAEMEDEDEAETEEEEVEVEEREAPVLPTATLRLVRMGTGVGLVEHLRGRDIAAYIDHGAGDEMRAQSEGHPIGWYKEVLDSYLIPNASLVGLARVSAEALAALGYLTGWNRRFAALLGLLVSANDLLAESRDHERRSRNIVMALVHLLLLRTGT